jgi:hypothetical protein
MERTIMKKQGMPSRSVPRGGGKSNVVRMSDKKKLTPAQVKALAVAQKAKATAKRIANSPAAEDIRRGNLDNFNRIVRNKPVKKSPFGPVAAGIVKPKPKPKGKK